ncbi:MAG: glycosyltransferase, partial [Cyclobacteriaceae bacterium]|nr:glycosyltransferase [Cyclobacteriaceae bacterium]
AIGRCVPQKGFDVLLSAFARLKDPALSLTLIGSGSGLPMLQKQAEALSISGQVCFLGNVSRDEIVNQLHGHDLFVMSSRHESYGLVVAEAQACGLPVVSTRCGGPEDILTDQTGIFCEPDDPDVLASAIRKAMGRRWDTQWIREHARSRFSSSAFTEQLFSIYRSVLK